MTVPRSVLLFALAALAEIGGVWLIWQGVREHRGLPFVGVGILALGSYGFVATFQPDPPFRAHPGRLRRGVRGRLPGLGRPGGRLSPRRYDLVGAALCLAGVAVIMCAPRAS
jgi:small multidrug resistance family-3 protein